MWNNKICLFMFLLHLPAVALSLTPQTKIFFSSIKKDPPNDQISKMVSWLSQENLNLDDRLFLSYWTAKIATELGNYRVAEQFYQEVSSSNHALAPFSAVKLLQIYCGLSVDEKKCLSYAQELKHSKKIRATPSLKWTLFETELQFLLNSKKWIQASSLLKKNRKQFTASEQIQSILKWEAQVAKSLGQNDLLCQVERQIFISYPLIDIDRSFVEFLKSCRVTIDDKRKIIRKMLLIGMSDRIKYEINNFDSLSGLSDSELSIIQADVALSEGDTKKALTILEELISKKQSSTTTVLSLYAIALSREQKFQEASQVYQRLSTLHSNRVEKSQALFDSAFVLYQGGLYHQAAQIFSQYLKKDSRGVYADEARWYLGWISFLTGEYESARIQFENLIRSKKYSEKNKLFYWLAKTYWQLNFKQEATAIMTALSQQKLRIYSFYVNLAKQWLQQNQLKPSLNNLVHLNGINCGFLFACTEILNFESPFLMVRPDLDKMMSFFESNSKSELGELVSTESDDKSTESIDLQVLSESEAYGVDFSDRLRFAQNLVEIDEIDLALSEIKTLYETSKLHAQKLILLKVFEGFQKYDDSSRRAELFLLNNPNVERLPWIRLAFPKAYLKEVETFSKQFGVQKSFIFSIIRAESFFNPKVESPVHARGLMQLMPFTAQQVSKIIGEPEIQDLNVLFNPEKNIKLGSAYLARLLRQFDQNHILAAAAYNAGPHRVQTWLSQFGHHDQDVFVEHIPFKETRSYVKKVLGFMEYYDKPVALLGPINVREAMRMPASKERWDDI